MAVPSRGARKTTETVVNNNSIQVVPCNNKKKVVVDRDRLHRYHHNHQTITSPERRMVWMEPKSKPKMEIVRKVPVVYYLSKDGHLEHPHFIEVPLSCNDGLYLNDVINRLNSLRGKGMASMYSWSSKRSYKNGFVWHDLCENDFIYPAHGQEYVLKGSEFLETFSSFRSQNQEVIIPEKLAEPETQHYHHKSVGESNNEFPVVVVQTQRSRNQSWSSIDDNHHNHLHEYKVYKTESSSTGEYSGKAADAATQTQTDHEKRRIRSSRRLITEEEDDDEQNQTTELSREEISPPPSSSSPETLESMIKADVRIKSNIISEPLSSSDIRNLTGNNHPSGRVKASAVLKQLISCGSFTVKDGGGPEEEESSNQGFSFIQHYRARLPHDESSYHGAGNDAENPSCFSEIGLEEDKEYFSGSLVGMNKDDYAGSSFTRSSSYNADSSKPEIEKETRVVGEDEYIQKRKPKTSPTNKDSSDNTNKISRTPLHGSKKHSHDPIR